MTTSRRATEETTSPEIRSVLDPSSPGKGLEVEFGLGSMGGRRMSLVNTEMASPFSTARASKSGGSASKSGNLWRY